MAKIDENKLKAIEMAMGQIEKQFGKGSVMKLGEDATANIYAVSTGCLDLDIALGIGGVPRGRIIEIYGPESSGKTTIALHVVAEAQKLGGAAAYIDAEHALDPGYASKLGVDIDNLPYEKIVSDEVKEKLGEVTFISATDGNHGRGVAWTANKLKQKSKVNTEKSS